MQDPQRQVQVFSLDDPPVDVVVYMDMWTPTVELLMETLGQAQQEGIVHTDGCCLPIDSWIEAAIEARVMQARAHLAQAARKLAADMEVQGLDEAIERILDEGDVTE